MNEERNRKIADFYLAGNTLERCGREFSLTRERVRQLLVRLKIKTRRNAEEMPLPPESITLKVASKKLSVAPLTLLKIAKALDVPVLKFPWGLYGIGYLKLRDFDRIERAVKKARNLPCKSCGKRGFVKNLFRKYQYCLSCLYGSAKYRMPEWKGKHYEYIRRYYHRLKKEDPARWKKLFSITKKRPISLFYEKTLTPIQTKNPRRPSLISLS